MSECTCKRKVMPNRSVLFEDDPNCPVHALAARPQEQASQPDTRYDNLKFVAKSYERQLNEIQEILIEAGLEPEAEAITIVEGVRRLVATRQQASQPPEAQPWLDLEGSALRKEIEAQFERSFTSDTVEAIARIIERDRELAFQRGAQSMAEKAAQAICCFCAEGVPLTKEKTIIRHEGRRYCYAYAIHALAGAATTTSTQGEPLLDRLEKIISSEPHAEDCHQIIHCTLTTCDCWKAKMREALCKPL